MKFDQARALHLLRLSTDNPDATFRTDQDVAIRHVVESRGRLLLVQRTGWGKSNVYFIATRMLREQGLGPSLLVSPLLALMRNQIMAANRIGVRAATINSTNREQWFEVEEQLGRDEVDILLISPERLANEQFRQSFRQIAGHIAMLVIDEAHCISDWGHDFRPDYRRLETLIQFLPPNLRVLGTTATANRRVMDDLEDILGPHLRVMRSDLHRPSLTLQTLRLPEPSQRMAWLAAYLPRIEGNGIIYTLTIRDAERVADWLQTRGLQVAPYTGKMPTEQRIELENLLLANRIKALVATTALGMGFDKPDLGFVIHYQTPGSPVSYYQQVGRAGRAVDKAYGILLSGREDTDITDFFIRNAFPTPDEAAGIIDALAGASQGLTLAELETKVNIRRGGIAQAVKILALEAPPPIVKQGSRWQLTTSNLSRDFWARVARLTALREQEKQQMQQYVNLTEGHMEFLIRALDGAPGVRQPSRLPPLGAEISPELQRDAVRFARRSGSMVEPRKQWPSGHGDTRFRGSIPLALRAQPGKVLCAWNDDGWGPEVRAGKYDTGRFADDLVQACTALVSNWRPAPAPAWVTCIPSVHRPLVHDFAQRLAQALGLPFRPALCKIDERPPQKEMCNSSHQFQNVCDAMAVDRQNLFSDPVLLVDDMVDSRWTLTMAAWLLRSAGCGPVWPLALADTGGHQ